MVSCHFGAVRGEAAPLRSVIEKASQDLGEGTAYLNSTHARQGASSGRLGSPPQGTPFCSGTKAGLGGRSRRGCPLCLVPGEWVGQHLILAAGHPHCYPEMLHPARYPPPYDLRVCMATEKQRSPALVGGRATLNEWGCWQVTTGWVEKAAVRISKQGSCT